jgi:hypothetical protein
MRLVGAHTCFLPDAPNDRNGSKADIPLRQLWVESCRWLGNQMDRRHDLGRDVRWGALTALSLTNHLGPPVMTLFMNYRAPWTTDQIGELRRLAQKGLPARAIAREMGRTSDSIYRIAAANRIPLRRS